MRLLILLSMFFTLEAFAINRDDFDVQKNNSEEVTNKTVPLDAGTAPSSHI